MRRTAALRLALTTAVVGALGVAAVVVVVARSGGDDTGVTAIDPGAVGHLASQAPATTPAPAAPSSTPRPSATPVASGSTAPRTSRAATPTDPAPVGSAAGTPSRPVRVDIGAVSLDAPVVPVGVGADGEVQIPERISTVGWYRYAGEPGAGQGSTVLVGHVDSAVDGEGAFFRLRNVGRGDTVRVRTAAGRELTYRVISRVQFPKPDVPLDDLFAVTGAPRLTLITCGGSFDATRRSYRDNVVVTAVPR